MTVIINYVQHAASFLYPPKLIALAKVFSLDGDSVEVGAGLECGWQIVKCRT